ncbi:hypothetical protein K458DRAFT_185978 [Lentithecium fluviatile CBS 122367]|uniref:Uncharacterized protein n=1 Tax=Lentithecium fluviatile CBS 122367 TaxID=1168545 RepID=A0A6G1JAC6_9PLEO|nr:hypothetical protein K458DRAFT_185978 [Lentithecium fluviatile CBS 122367]
MFSRLKYFSEVASEAVSTVCEVAYESFGTLSEAAGTLSEAAHEVGAAGYQAGYQALSGSSQETLVEVQSAPVKAPEPPVKVEDKIAKGCKSYGGYIFEWEPPVRFPYFLRSLGLVFFWGGGGGVGGGACPARPREDAAITSAARPLAAQVELVGAPMPSVTSRAFRLHRLYQTPTFCRIHSTQLRLASTSGILY